jgi:hypothetical protein
MPRQAIAPDTRLCQIPTGMNKAQSLEYVQIMAATAIVGVKTQELGRFQSKTTDS